MTDRCDEERHLLRQDPEARKCVLRALRAAIEATGIGLLAFVIMSNHWHLVIRLAEDAASLARFMQQLKSEVARELNGLRGRRGGFWADRYHAIPILDEEALLDRITYTLMNPVAAGLVAKLEEYPGLSSAEANLGVRAACGEIDLPIELPPSFAELDDAALESRRTALLDEVRRREAAVKAERIAQHLPRPKAERSMTIDPFERPECPARRAAPRCFAATQAARDAFDEILEAFVHAYRVASAAFRNGRLDTVFPAGSFLPWSWRHPRRSSLGDAITPNYTVARAQIA